jgi:hypothetical protein
MTALLKAGDAEMLSSPWFRARIRHAARAADWVDFVREGLGEEI